MRIENERNERKRGLESGEREERERERERERDEKQSILRLYSTKTKKSMNVYTQNLILQF